MRHLRVGRLLTVDRPLTDATTKKATWPSGIGRWRPIGNRRAWPTFAGSSGCDFLAIRAIREPCDSLPIEVDNVVRQRSWPGRIGAVAAAMFHRPSSLPELLRRGEDSLVAGERLGQFLAGVIKQLD